MLSSEDKKSEILLEFEENLQSQEEVVKKGINFFQSIDVGEDDLCYLYFDKNNLIPSEVMGLVASYIVNYYKIPALILKEKNGIIGCEARSTEGLNLVKAFDTCSKHLIQYGGHAKAAGFTCEKANVSSFERSFLDHLESIKTMIEECKVIEIDAILEYDKINELNNYLETDYHFLQPYGEGNLSPIFLIKNYDLQSNQLNIHDNIDNDEVYKADIIIQRSGNGFNLIDYDVLNRSKNEN